ncbi:MULTISPECIES: hypothetical protein [Pseudomonadota]|uniref:hypothetical protein n=1 Tax=Pseudomonadota TaxID=1224 RepID=UPI00261E1755|nr:MULTISPECIES: hypothetical protein [Pseudomonadota]
MSNSFVAIATRMDDLIGKISNKDAETKDYADRAVAAHAERLALEAELGETQKQLAEAPIVITNFLKALTVLPPLVLEADTVADAEALALAEAEAAEAAAATAELEAAEAVTEEINPGADSIVITDNPAPVDAAADPVGAAAALEVPGLTPVDAPATAPEPVTPTPEPVIAEQPVSVTEPVAGDLGLPGAGSLGLPGADTLGQPAVTEPAPEQPTGEPETPTVAEPALGDPEMVDEQPTLPDMPTPASDEAPSVTEPATEPAAPETSTEGLDAEATETGPDPVVAEPDAPAEPTGELDPLTGLPKPQL